jgi:hypothetical protein
VHSWNFIFLFTRLSQYCGDIFHLCLPTLLIETHCHWFLYQFVYRPMSDERLPPQVVFSCLRSGRAARSYCGCHALLLVGLHTATNLDGLHAVTLTGSLPIACRFTCGLSWLALWPFPVSDVTVRLDLVSVSDIMVGLDSFSLLRTVSRSYSTVLWGLFIPKHSWELDISF